MAENEPAQGSPYEACRGCSNWNIVKERVRLMELLQSAIDKMHKALQGDGFKPTLGDYVKLIQMEKDLDEAASETREIRVTWVEQTDSKSEV